MKRTFLFVVTIVFSASLVLSSYFTQSGYAQTTAEDAEAVQEEESFEDAYREYQEAIEAYRVAHEDYVLKRSQYLRFKTQTAQTAARDATATMLQERDEVVIRYLLALKAKVVEAIGITQAREEALSFRIDEEVSWFSDHKERVPSAGTLDDLVQDSSEAQRRFEGNEGFHYEVLANIGVGKINDFIQRVDSQTSSMKEKVDEIRNEERQDFRFSDRKLQVLDRWIFEAETRTVRAREKQAEAESQITDLSRVQKAGLSKYNDIVKTLGESQLFLKEAAAFMQEIIREIKTAEE